MTLTVNPTANRRHLAARLIAIAWLALLQGLLPLLHAHPQGGREPGDAAPAGLHLPDRHGLAEGSSSARPTPTITAQDDRSRLADAPPAAAPRGEAGLLARLGRDAGGPWHTHDPAPPSPAPRACAGPPRGPPAAA